jgi:class 3 adenylate cyclase/tetratricopeptide (TPR) repeat protein
MPACAHCGEQNPERARFCLACGTPFPDVTRDVETRRTVTVVFADLVGSTSIGEGLDPEAHRRVQSRYFEELRGVLERHGGTVEKYIGDAVMAVFGTPVVHEDDALRAIRAATEMREVLSVLNDELRQGLNVALSVRTGINTGEVAAGDPTTGQRLVTGDAVNLASRLETAATPGEILIGDDTYRLVRNAVLVEPVDELDLKGKAEPTKAWRVLAVLTGAPSVARRFDSPLVGRERELTLLRQTFERAANDHASHLLTILGPAGAGKSRLARELLDSVDGQATPLVGRCLPYGEGITFWPVMEIVKRAAGVGPTLALEESRQRIASIVAPDPDADLVAERLSAILGLDSDGAGTDEIFWSVRKLLEALARERPVVVLFDDVHWGEQTFLDLIEHLADCSRDAPVLIVCLARPELLEERPMWSGGKLNSTSLLLEPLDDEACGTLIENLLDHAEVDDVVKQRIAQAAEGNPLFVEEMLAVLVEEGALRRDDGRWVSTRDLSAVAIPPTIQALLGARIGRLGRDERNVLERAAVAGRIFSRGAVRALSPVAERSALEPRLAGLVQKQLIRPHRTDFGAEHTYRFRHNLIRDAVYQHMSKANRAELHERFAGWLEGAGEGKSAERDEILGYHLEQAFRYRQELGRPDEQLGTRAGERLARAGRRAVDRGDLPAAVSLLTRATALLPDAHGERREILPMLGSALIRTGDFPRAERVLTEALEAARAAGDRRLELRTIIEREFYRAFTDPAGTVEEVVTVADEVIPLLEDLGDDLGLAKAWWLKSEVHVNACRWGERAKNLERALEHARRAGDASEQSTLATFLMQALYYGPTPVDEAIGRGEKLLADRPDDRSLKASITGAIAGLNAMGGEFDEARRLQADARALYEALGQRFRIALWSLVAAEIEALAGQPEAAAAILRWAFHELEDMGWTSVMSTMAAFLAAAVPPESDDALHYSRLSEGLAADEDVVTQVMWRIARARATGDEELARQAVRLAEPTDYPDLKARAFLSLGEVARDPVSHQRAIAEYERKGNVAAIARLVVPELRS